MMDRHCRCLVTVGFAVYLMENIRLCLAVRKIGEMNEIRSFEALIVMSF